MKPIVEINPFIIFDFMQMRKRKKKVYELFSGYDDVKLPKIF